MIDISFVGGGLMAEAIAGGILRQKISTPDRILVCDPDDKRQMAIRERLGVRATASNLEALEHGEILVLAVKPQTLRRVSAELQGKLRPSQLLLSIVAGVGLSSLAASFQHRSVVRVMPNTPAQILQGMSVWIASPEVSEVQGEQARAILAGLGSEIRVDDEKYLDMATAVSGSGPAYVALFVEALLDAAVLIGIPRPMAQQMVLQTVLGSTNLIRETGRHPAEVRNMVTSPGGTTAAGLQCLEAGRLRAVLSEAVIAAYDKARLLGGAGQK